MSRKIGFWPVFALVTGSQIGSGVFMLPASLAQFGKFSLIGWLISGAGAVFLALTFAQLCSRIPKTGGPHAYVQEAFGSRAAFFTGWTYWVISWMSTTAVVIASIGYLTPLIGLHSSFTNLVLQLSLLFIITAINLRGVKTAGMVEFVLTNIKLIPLILMPIVALFYFNSKNLIVVTAQSHMKTSEIISHVTMLTMWGFIGLESATTPAGAVENPAKTIPRAVVFGTLTVAVIYLLNSLGIMGVVPGLQLMNSQAPYADVARIVFGGNWYLLISLLASIVCIGTLNAWMLTSSQISLGLANDKLMPNIFKKHNKFGAPKYSLYISCVGIALLLLLTVNNSFAQKINTIIDIAVTAFLFVYLICVCALLAILKKSKDGSWLSWLYAILAGLFCIWIIFSISLKILFIASLFILSGVPVYIYQKIK